MSDDNFDPRPSPLCIEDDLDTPSRIDEIETIRKSVNELAASERLDKESALAMTRLFHSLEMLMRHEFTRRDAKIARLEGEIERSRMQHELDRITNVQIQQQQQVESTPLRRGKSKW